MIRIGKPWRRYRPWHIIGDNGGEVPVSRQWLGLSSVDMKGKSVLDIGCAEGLISLKCESVGAKLVHGVELRPRAVEVARSLAGHAGLSDHVKFFEGDLSGPERALNQPGMLDSYDIVIANAVIQKVKAKGSRLFEAILAKCGTTLILRMPERRLQTGRKTFVDPVTRTQAAGFEMEWEACGHPHGEPPYPLEGESWLALFHRKT